MQSFTEISPDDTLASSLQKILDNDKTVMSDSSGTAFPTTNLFVGMRCLRTDQNKTYRLDSINANDVATWVMMIDHAKTILYTDGKAADSSLLDGKPLYGGPNSAWNSIPFISPTGAIEVGRYIDFHGASADAVDNTVRLDGGAAGSTTLTLTGSFVASGDVSAFSDERLKEDWQKFGPDFTERLAKINYGTYARKDMPGRRYVGVGAQSFGIVCKEALDKQDDEMGTLRVNLAAALAICAHLAGEIVNLKNQLTQPKAA